MSHEPDYLFHYTSIRTLALILKNRNIRLSRLDQVDDVSESITDDSAQYAKYLFVSCWTDHEDESIPFWHMYTPNMAGARIKLPRQMFRSYNLIPNSPQLNRASVLFNCILPSDRLRSANYLIPPQLYDKFVKIEYTNDDSKLFPRLLNPKTEQSWTIEMGNLGRYKRLEWSFQSEWRYRLPVYPISLQPYLDDPNLETEADLCQQLVQMVHGKESAFDEFFLELNDKAFATMEILLGPKHTEGDLAIVEALISAHNPSANLYVSHLSGSLR